MEQIKPLSKKQIDLIHKSFMNRILVYMSKGIANAIWSDINRDINDNTIKVINLTKEKLNIND